MIQTNELITMLFLIIITIISSFLGNTKTILMIKSKGYLKYILVFIDTILFGLIIQKISKGQGVTITVAFALSKVIGSYLAVVVSEKYFIFKTYNINLYSKEEHLELIEKYLLTENVSFTIIQGMFKGKTRYIFDIHANELQKDNLLSFLEKNKIVPNLDISEVETYGKLSTRTQ